MAPCERDGAPIDVRRGQQSGKGRRVPAQSTDGVAHGAGWRREASRHVAQLHALRGTSTAIPPFSATVTTTLTSSSSNSAAIAASALTISTRCTSTRRRPAAVQEGRRAAVCMPPARQQRGAHAERPRDAPRAMHTKRGATGGQAVSLAEIATPDPGEAAHQRGERSAERRFRRAAERVAARRADACQQ